MAQFRFASLVVVLAVAGCGGPPYSLTSDASAYAGPGSTVRLTLTNHHGATLLTQGLTCAILESNASGEWRDAGDDMACILPLVTVPWLKSLSNDFTLPDFLSAGTYRYGYRVTVEGEPPDYELTLYTDPFSVGEFRATR